MAVLADWGGAWERRGGSRSAAWRAAPPACVRPGSTARRLGALFLLLLTLLRGAAADQPREPPRPSSEELARAIDDLGRFEFAVRTQAARTLRRAPPEDSLPALLAAVEHHEDGYVRYRALVLLSGIDDRRARAALERALDDPNDRLRAVAYAFLARHPNPALTPRLLAALDREGSEFVRPALVRALGALGHDARVREALLVEAGRGEDVFRSAVLEALGESRAHYAVATLVRIAQQDGPLQDDAILALGRIGDTRALEPLAALQRRAPRELQPALAAAICLLGLNCDAHRRYLVDTMRFAAATAGFQPLLRAAAAALAALAAAGDAEALEALLEAGVSAREPARAPIALAVGAVALRNAPLALAVLERRPQIREAALLLRDAFDMLEEDFEEEQFFVALRRVYWDAPAGSARRAAAELLIDTLEF
jgi:HEAT repeat protein